MNFIDVNVINGSFEIEGVKFDGCNIPDGYVTVGIRAEKMTCGDKSVFVKPEITEMTGGERIVYFNLNNCRCSAKVPMDYLVGDNIELKISSGNMYFFDSESGEVIKNEKV